MAEYGLPLSYLRPWQALVSLEEYILFLVPVGGPEASFLCWSRLLDGSGEGSRGRGLRSFLAFLVPKKGDFTSLAGDRNKSRTTASVSISDWLERLKSAKASPLHALLQARRKASAL